MSSPRNWIWPEVARTSPTRVFAIVLFPHPLSPTRPNTSPSAIEKVTPSTAWTLTSPPPRIRWTKPRNTGKYTRRSRTSRRASLMLIDLVQVAFDLPAVLSHKANLGEDGLAYGLSLLASRVERAADRFSKETRRSSRDGVQLRR